MGKYAEDTHVPVERSRAEIEKILTKYGSDQFTCGWGKDKAVIAFRMQKYCMKIEMPLPIYHVTEDKRGHLMGTDQVAKETRRRWRALVLYIKAKLESVESEIMSFETAFFAHIVLPNKQTASEFLLPKIRDSQGSGEMPKMLPGW